MAVEILNTEDFQQLTISLNYIKEQLAGIKEEASNRFKIYSNKELRELLGVQDKLIRKYRDEGKLAYHKEGDKFWYTQQDINAFLNSNYYKAYAIA